MLQIRLPNGYEIKCLNKNESVKLEYLCEKCADYYLLSNGALPTKEDIQEIFTELPPNKTLEDKFVLGVYQVEELVGLIDIVRDYPTVGEWMLGLLLIDPAKRGNGLGKNTHASLVKWAKVQGARTFRIGVIQENITANKFWSNLGYIKFKEVQMEYSEKTHQVNVMRLYI